MEIINIDNIPQGLKVYGGVSCHKIGLVIDGVQYLVKFPGNLRNRSLKNVMLSYSNSPVCEYIGSHVFELLGIPVHNTILA